MNTSSERIHALLMACYTGQKPLGRPTPIAIHDDGHMMRRRSRDGLGHSEHQALDGSDSHDVGFFSRHQFIDVDNEAVCEFLDLVL